MIVAVFIISFTTDSIFSVNDAISPVALVGEWQLQLLELIRECPSQG
jgi:hypothetical protein